MIRPIPLFALAFAFASLCAGCGANYTWKSSVPSELRTICVPTFRNESDVSEMGAVASRQVLREIQREGTFVLRNPGDAALEVQGVVKAVTASVKAYDRSTEMRLRACDIRALVEVSVVDKRRRKVLVDNRQYRPTVRATVGLDETTAVRDASGRLMEELARQVVDDLLKLK